jgi:TonB family protein
VDGGPNPESDKALIRSVIAAHRDEIRTCYERALEHVPQLWGKVTVRFVINPDGSATAPSTVESTVGNRELEQCIFRKLVTWRFPRTANGIPVVVTYPFLFKQKDEPDAGVPDAGVPDAGT